MELGKLTAVFDADTKKFDAGLRHVEHKIGGVTKDIGRVTASSGQAGSALSSLGGALGIAAGSAVIATAAISSAAAGIYKLASFSQKLGGEIFDLSEKINFSAETLSTLKVAAELSGGSLASLSTSLGIFDRNIEEAKDSSTEMSKVFKALKIDTDNNEKALREAFTALASLERGSQQTALAMKLFGRSGKEVLGIVKETGGSIEKFNEMLGGTGRVTSEAAKKADEFDKKIVLLQTKLEDIARQIGSELVPTVEKATDDISRWLKENQGEIIKTAKEVAGLVSEFYNLAKAVASPFIAQVIITRKFVDILGSGPNIPGQNAGPDSGTLDLGSMNAPSSLPSGLNPLSVFQRRSGGGTTFSPFAPSAYQKPPDLGLGNTGRGGRGGGGRSRSDPAIQLLKDLEEQYRNLTPRTELQKVQQKLLNDEYARSRDEIKKKIMITATEIDQQTKILELTRERFATDTREREKALSDILHTPMQSIDALIRLFETMEDAFKASQPGGVNTATSALEKLGEPPEISAHSQAILDMRERIRDEMINLGHDLTSVFSRAIGDGFERGAKRGLQSLALGLLDIVQNIFLRKLAEGLGNILSDIALGSGSGSSGGFFSGLLRTVLGAAVGTAAGAAAGSAVNLGGGSTYTPGGTGATRPRVVGNRAMGGPVLAGLPYQVHKDEMIVPTQNGMVFNKGQQGSVNNYYIQLPQTPKGGYSSPSSQRELANKLVAALQGANT